MIYHLVLSSLLLLSSTCSAEPSRRGADNPDPSVSGSPDAGWGPLPDIPDATLHTDWVIDADKGAKIPAFQTSGLDQSAVKRAVIVLPGEPRDCWYYWNVMNNALYVANAADASLKREEISIFAPCFFTQVDVTAGAAQKDSLVFGDTTWISGQKNVGPDGVSDLSSYDVLDDIVDYYMDRTAYPNLNVVMIAGHSAGAQMAQRYLALRKKTNNDDRLHYWIANPGSILWLTADRPHPDASCDGFDTFKYGLADGFPAYDTSDAKKLGREGLVARYRNRYAHYAWGLADDGPGDVRCQAETQGATHLERGQNFVKMLEGMDGGMPNHTTVDWVEGASHDNAAMMNSAEGTDKLFRYFYNGNGSTETYTSPTAGQGADADGASPNTLISNITFLVALALGVSFL
ncbi:hypothetical protein CPB85DRAFT_288993 [Mucidula mucida]|nr:hypothetical protein CPB85DRAFT_288993 [Mucidula mucida]